MKKFKVLLVTLILILGAMFFYQTYAYETRNLGVQLNRPFTNSRYQFRAGANGADKVYTVVKIYDNADRNTQDELLYSKALYCLRGGLGFGSDDETDIATTPITYTEFGEMHKNADSVIAKYEEYYDVNLDRVETINGKTINIYNAILWILDEAYLPVDSTNYSEVEYKEELLTKVGIAKARQADITKDDLEVIQQLAIWYFANYDEQKAGNLQSVSRLTKFPAQFLSINGNNNIDSVKEENLNKIYQYFIYGAADNNTRYQGTTERNKYIGTNEFDKDVELEIESIDYEETIPNIYHPELYYYKIGPFKIQNDVNEGAGREALDVTSIALFDAGGNTIKRFYEIPEEDEETGEIISGGLQEIYTFINAEGQIVTELEKGVNYYIKFKKVFEKGFALENENDFIPETEKYDVSEVTLKLSSSYSLSTATFLVRNETDQPVVEINKEKISESDEITTRPPKEFDLALRKFITSIKGQALTGNDSRVPKINTNTLINGIEDRNGNKEYTATYTHPKNALSVETGDKVVYTIRIYNEGELDGKATSVTDYLPTGLTFVPASESTINDEYGWTNPSGDGKTIVTDYLKNTNIKSFDKTKTTQEAGWQKATTGVSGLYYADLQIECEVIAETSEENQELRNIAAITEDSGDDRDSVPGDPGRTNYNPPTDNSTYKEDDDDYENLVLPTKSFDLSLRKFISKVERNEEELEIASRVPVIQIEDLKDGESTTAKYIHPKNKLNLKRGDIIYYTIRVYNEGDLDGYATLVKDYLPEGLELVEGKNAIWTVNGNVLSTDSLKNQKLLGYDKSKTTGAEGWQKASDDETGLYYYDLTVVCKIKNNVEDWTTLVNIAEISDDKSEPTDIADKDSQPNNFPEGNKNNNYEGNGNDNGYYPGKQDDDDFERVTVEPDKVFDLSLRKFITSIKRNNTEVDFEDRTPEINTTTLIYGTFDRNGQKENTATYEHSKQPLVVKKGDIITYTLRIYNEGERDGFATEIKDYIPEGLALILNYNTNFDNGWKLPQNLDESKIIKLVGEKGFYKTQEEVKNLKLEDFKDTTSLNEVQLITGEVNITTTELNNQLIKAFDKAKTAEETGWQKATTGEGGLYYKDVQVSCLVIADNTCKDVLTNIAEISEDKDETGEDVTDRDSTPDNVPTKNEDDDDYEPVILKYFDLALRKFITGVETNGKTEDVTTRIPVPTMGEDENIVYNHTKDPVYVANNDIVIYTIRVYNEGTIAGYAEEITDDIPEGLKFLPEHNTNQKYEWIMIDKEGKETKKIEEAVKITTDYLSEEKEAKSKLVITDETTGQVIQSEVRDNLIDPFDSSKPISTQAPLNPDYRDIKVAFKVTEPNTSDRIIINSAQISEDSDDDEDSIPGEWNDGEDDQDKEYIYVKYFDLSLLKWVTKTIVTVDGKTTTTETGFEPNTGKTETTGIRDNNEAEPIAKVEIDKKKLSKTTVKFVYKIRATNEGEIAGYATEITDYIPKGLEFLEEDNKAFGWVKQGEDKVTTRALETVLLQPGENAEVEIVFTWKKDANNLGLKTNIAEISEDYNDNNSEDIDSVPDNKKDPYEKEQEDDDDFALVILSIKTGKGVSYTILVISVLTLLSCGIYLIKKYVLTY